MQIDSRYLNNEVSVSVNINISIHQVWKTCILLYPTFYTCWTAFNYYKAEWIMVHVSCTLAVVEYNFNLSYLLGYMEECIIHNECQYYVLSWKHKSEHN